jgi:hypothetical protein
MSLEVKYTDRGTAIVTCGGLRTEISLTPPPGLIGQTLRIEPPPQENPEPSISTSAPNPVPPRAAPSPTGNPTRASNEPDWPSPKRGPSVMFVTPTIAGGDQWIFSEDLSFEKPDSVRQMYVSIDAFRSLRGEVNARSLRRIAKSVKESQIPAFNILDIGVTAELFKAGVDVTEFEPLFKDDDLGLDGIRLVLDDSFDPSER